MGRTTQPPTPNEDFNRAGNGNEKWWHISRSDFISFCAFILSIVVLILQCESQKEQDFKNKSVESRPRLELVGQPQIRGFGFKTDLIDPALFSGPSTADVKDIIVRGDVNADIVYRLKNSGSGVGQVLAVMIACGDSELPVLRDLLYENDFEDVTGLPRYEEIVPGDSMDYDVSADLVFFQDVNTFLHVLIIYANEFGNLYDSYFCAEIGGSDFSFLVGLDSTQVPQVAGLKTIDGVPLRKAVRMKSNANDMYKTYTKDECDKLEPVLEVLRKQVLKK